MTTTRAMAVEATKDREDMFELALDLLQRGATPRLVLELFELDVLFEDLPAGTGFDRCTAKLRECERSIDDAERGAETLARAPSA